MRLKKIVSGAQTGADVAGLNAAKAFGMLTGGWIPKGFLTQDGPKPEYKDLYGIQEHSSDKYAPRTYANVKDSDATIRFAVNFSSAGEICTYKAIAQYNKPCFDVQIKDTKVFSVDDLHHPDVVVKWLEEHDVEVLNVAGNSEKTAPGIEAYVFRYMSAVLTKVING